MALFKKNDNAPAAPRKTGAAAPLSASAGVGAALPHRVRNPLNAIIRRRLYTGLARGFFILLGTSAALVALQCLLDWWLDFPRLVRLVFFLADLTVLGWLGYRNIGLVWKNRLNLATAALQAEKATPGLKSVLISAVQLSSGPSGPMRDSPDLLGALVDHAGERIRSLDLGRIVPSRPMWKSVRLGLLAFLVVAGLGYWQGGKSVTLLQRFFLLNPPLPTQTIVRPLTGGMSVPIGANVEVAAMAEGVVPSRGRVTIAYANGQSQEIGLTGSVGRPEVFSHTLKNVQQSFTYRFVLNDGHSAEFSVRAQLPPNVAQLDCEEIYPAYTGLSPIRRTPGNLGLLAGSKLSVRVASNQPLKSAGVRLQGLDRKLGMKIEKLNSRVATVEIPVPAKGLTGFSIELANEEGISSASNTVYSIEVIPDKVPEVELLWPKNETETLTLKAKPEVRFGVSDDYALGKLALVYMVTGAGDSGEAEQLRRIEFPVEGKAGQVRLENYIWDIAASTPPVKEGQSLTYWIEAEDNNNVTGPGIGRSKRQQFVLLSEQAKKEEIAERIRKQADELDRINKMEKEASEEVKALIK